MNDKDRLIAEKIWPEKMPVPYAERIEAAKRWLGDRYLLAKPVNAHHKTPMFLRLQAG